ncbi:tyrosine-type recombinase/integrase [Microbacterium sp. KSW4-16]|uniref:tyrosine-type recombinase/integrase n=1 Tax=Microbacterium aurugineum TaxID=2851642 RepID=UPI0020C0DB2E|nr:tyrosine-type recombinase/integrase [Microbacterium aurugineum]MCK8468260.1 tyrosine-type recombinase/integrase [Microbacterium aurugineum]
MTSERRVFSSQHAQDVDNLSYYLYGCGMRYRSIRITFPSTAQPCYAVVDGQAFEPHPEATAFITWMLNGRSSSINTLRAYSGRVALFLSWASRRGLDWHVISLTQLAWYKAWLEKTPVGAIEPSPRLLESSSSRFRSGKTVNAHITALSEFLRFAAREGVVAERVAAQLSLKHGSGYERYPSKSKKPYRKRSRSRLLVARETEKPLLTISDLEMEKIAARLTNARDYFLVRGLRSTGLRIGEQLGLRRSDMHLLPTSRHLGCPYEGAHIHVNRRTDNSNGALAKSVQGRFLPVDGEYVAMYRDYMVERSRTIRNDEQDLLFVNLFHAPIGGGLTYGAVRSLFERLSALTGIRVRPHMLRHSFATSLSDQGVRPDVVQALLGHADPDSLGSYVHPLASNMRDAVARASTFRYEPPR